MIEIKRPKIFLASSSELKEDREQFEIFINRKNKQYIKQGIFLDLVIWEDFFDAMSQTRLQDEYNKAISECDLFVSLFKTKVGQYTEEEVMTAYENFKKNNKPLIYTYFKEAQINISEVNPEDLQSLKNFQNKLSNLGHFYTKYNSIEDLKYRFDQQLNKAFEQLIKDLAEKSTVNSSRKQEYQQQLTEKESIINQLQQQIDDLTKPILSTNSTEIELKSEKGVDYTKLRDFLTAGKWKEADEETADVMLQVMGQDSWWLVTTSDIDNFPCDDLLTIDKLWVHYSKGKFGFSVQKKIYVDELGGTRDYNEKTWYEFCDRIGWREGRSYVSYEDLTFELLDTTPIGHLPGTLGHLPGSVSRGGVVDEGRRWSVFSRAKTCNL